MNGFFIIAIAACSTTKSVSHHEGNRNIASVANKKIVVRSGGDVAIDWDKYGDRGKVVYGMAFGMTKAVDNQLRLPYDAARFGQLCDAEFAYQYIPNVERAFVKIYSLRNCQPLSETEYYRELKNQLGEDPKSY